MDFFQAQDLARRKSKLLVVYYIAAVVSIVAVIYFVALWALKFTEARSAETSSPYEYGYEPGVELSETPSPAVSLWRPELFAMTTAGTLLIIVGGSLFKTLALRSGGGVVARSVGGVRVDPQTTDLAQRRLLNVVEEMAIASGVRVPEVYLLSEDGINAFAAGWSPDDAAVAVTHGALATLSRDELQGVIAHEFSHILNGDMRLNIRLIGLLFGILLLAVIGRSVVYSLRFSGGGRSRRDKNSGGALMAIMVIGFALLVVGYVGVLFGRLIQAAVSRQREFLADASAVQFTRNPAGIAGALKKIGGISAGSRIQNVHATETSHLFFANALSSSLVNLFATHPPLVARIRAIEPGFDGKFPPAAAAAADRASNAPAREARGRSLPTPPDRRRSAPPPVPASSFMQSVAEASDRADFTAGAALIDAIPESLRDAAHDPLRARAIVLALLYGARDRPAVAKQEDVIRRLFVASERAAFAEILVSVAQVPEESRLALLDLALPAIRTLPAEQISTLLTAVDELITADEQTTIFEFALRQIAARYLQRTGPAAKPGHEILSYGALREEAAVALSAIAHAGATDPAGAGTAFRAGAQSLGLIRESLALLPREKLDWSRMIPAFAALARAAPPIKKNVLAALARAAGADGTLQPAEQHLLRAIAAALDCPAPVLEGVRE